jgi:hypothetical protein
MALAKLLLRHLRQGMMTVLLEEDETSQRGRKQPISNSWADDVGLKIRNAILVTYT